MGDTPPTIRIKLVEFRFTKHGPQSRITIETSYGGKHDKRDIYINMHSNVVLDFGTRPVESVVED